MAGRIALVIPPNRSPPLAASAVIRRNPPALFSRPLFSLSPTHHTHLHSCRLPRRRFTMHAYSLKRLLSNPPLVVSLCSSLSTLLFFSFVKSVALFLCPDSLGSRWLIAPGKPPRLLTTATSWPSSGERGARALGLG